MNNELFLYNKAPKLSRFKIVGLIPSLEFQKCRYLTEKLHICYPKEYDKPEVRSMLNLDWEEYLTKMRRKIGSPYYLLKSAVVVYLDGELLGDDRALDSFIKEKYRLDIDIDFEDVVEKEIVRYFSELIERKKRKFAFLTIAIDEHVVGSMLFMLYTDLVPITCENFLNRCTTTNRSHGYKCARINRVAKHSWIQCGGAEATDSEMPCENYAVPHDRRGVLSMCNSKRHTNNNCQFFVTLSPTGWMDYNYVAFGQLIQGAEILNLIEKVTTYYEAPNRKIEIMNCGEFSLCPDQDVAYTKSLNPPYETLFSPDIKDDDDVDSILSEKGFKSCKYFLKTDAKSYMPFHRYSRMFDSYLQSGPEPADELFDRIPTGMEENVEKVLPPLDDDDINPLFRSSSFYQKQKASVASK